LPVDDRAGFEKHGWHAGPAQHHQLIEPIDAGFGVHQFAAVPAHQGQRVMRRISQAVRLQFLAEEPAETETAVAVAIILRDEDGITLEPVAEMALVARVFPRLQEIVRHRIVVDGQKEIGAHRVGPKRALDKTPRRRRGGDQDDGLVETGIDERPLDVIGELQIERVFRDTACADGAGHLEGVADIDNDAERRMRAAGGGLGGGRRAVFAPRRERAGAKDRDGDQGNRRDEAQPAHDTSMTHAPAKAARIRFSYAP
jgi:hypothetical protein